MATAKLKKGAGKTFKAGGAWIYDNEIEEVAGSYENGEIVTVEEANGRPLGRGFINDRSVIRIRMMTRDAGKEIDEDFLRERVHDCVMYRKQVSDMNCCRLIFGEADFLPGLVVDKFSDVLVVQSLALGIDRMKETILRLLKEELAENGYPVRGIYERSDVRVRREEGMPLEKGFLGDPFDTKVPITENGISYIVDVENGQKTGFFLDQKENRMAVRRVCKGARVLDCFTHTGSFALNAAAAGAREVIGIDSSETAIKEAEENARLNNMSGLVRFLTADVFDYLPELVRENELFDVVILDPPAFTKSRNSVKKATKGYREINRQGIKLLRDGGYLATCSCSHFMTPEHLEETILQAAKSDYRRLRLVEYREQAPDHPVLGGAEDSAYLKFFLYQVLKEK